MAQRILSPLPAPSRLPNPFAIKRWIRTSVRLAAIAAALTALPSTGQAKDKAVEDANAYYRKHIIAVNSEGSALMPTIRQKYDKNRKVTGYEAEAETMDGETPEQFTGSDPSKQWRKPYYEYMHQIFSEIERVRPKRVVIYIHGGMNFFTGAIEKGAQLADEYRGREDEEYRICICWSSNLYSTYGEHLTRNVEGLTDFAQAVCLLPCTLVSDFGTAAVNAPRTLARLVMNDAHAAQPSLFHRDRRAYARESELEWKRESRRKDGMDVSIGADHRQGQALAETMDVAAWLATAPAKATTAPIIDSLGRGAWQMMLRRSRTMFERETSFTSRYFERNEPRQLRVKIEQGRPVRPAGAELDEAKVKKIEQIIYTGRRGAVRLFFEEAERALGIDGSSKSRAICGEVTLIGHSMGAIVVDEILARFGRLQFDNIVFMAAACKTIDFLRIGIPYLERHPQSRFFNLCLHPAAERAEAQPAKLMIADPIYFPLELAPRGSLLVWIDSFLDHPESEGDRTLGRWENAILAADMFPESVNDQITMKAFGRDRPPASAPNYWAGDEPRNQKSGGLIPREYVNEPRQHGDFTRYKVPASGSSPNFKFTKKTYRAAEGRPLK